MWFTAVANKFPPARVYSELPPAFAFPLLPYRPCRRIHSIAIHPQAVSWLWDELRIDLFGVTFALDLSISKRNLVNGMFFMGD